MTAEREALATLADEVAAALTRFAATLRTSDSEPKPQATKTSGTPRGARQKAVLKLKGIKSPEGMTAVLVAKEVGVRQPNAYKLLESMVESGWLERVPDVEPAHWRAPDTDG